MKRTWGKLGGQLGLGFAAIGLLLIGLAWNGAASLDFVSGQVPYLLSGGALGLSLVVIGVTLVVVQNGRKDRAILEAELRSLSSAVARLATALGSGVVAGGGANGSALSAASLGPDMVLVGATSFHRPDCRLAEGKPLAAMPVAAAQAEGLTPCRICDPLADVAELEGAGAGDAEAGRRRVRRRVRG
ncbi:MAG TPA: hypothetical protein VFA94_16725 [Acidimicrobiales bacterium]|nr:hypothetical protein [Acidimicrobiales bacterium]